MSAQKSKNDPALAAQRCSVGEMACECDNDTFQVLRAGDDGNDPKVICQLGKCCELGWGTAKDLKAAVECYVRAAELGSYEALERFNNIYNDLEDDSSSESDDSSSKSDIGSNCSHESSCNDDFINKPNSLIKIKSRNAFGGFCEKAEQGDARAQFNTGFCYFHEIVTSEDKEKAGDMFLKAADQGCADAVWMLDCCRESGFGDGYNGRQGIELLKYAAEMGSAEAQYELGHAYYYGWTTYDLDVEKDYKQAAEWLQKAAGQSHAKATFELAECYCDGEGVQKDIKKAFKLFRKAALMGDSDAQDKLSDFYRHGYYNLSEDEWPVDIDFFEAAYCNMKTVDQGEYLNQSILEAIGLAQDQINELENPTSSFESAEIWYNIAKEYETGDGVEKDEKKAFKMYKLAARLGSTEGQVAFARCYEQGIGTEKNILQSMRWNIRAAMEGDAEATSALQKWLEQNGKQNSFKSEESMLTYAIIMLKELDPEQDLHLDILLCIIGPKAIYQTSEVFDFFNKGQDPPDNAKTFEMCKLIVKEDMRAVYWMVRHYQHSTNITNDFSDLPHRLEKETVLGKPETAYFLARCYAFELGIPKNEAKAVDFYKLAAEDNYTPALHELGRCYQDGIVVEQNIYKAIELCKKAAEEQYIPALKALADIYESDDHGMKDLEQTFEYRKRAAELGDADEQLRVGECYKDGIGVSEDDREAFCWFETAVYNGKYECYKEVAECYDRGIGTKVDEEAAFETYRRLATTLPTKENLIILAERLENGIGTEKDVTVAIKYYEQAGAHSKLGDIYYDGNYVDRNYETSLNHYKRAEEFNFVQLLSIIRIFRFCHHLRGDGLFYFKVLKLTALALRTENLKIEIIVW